jgi:hypothetical protein
MPRRSRPKAFGHFVPEPRQIPDQLAGHRHRSVLEPVELLEFKQSSIKRSGDNPPARGPQVHCECHLPCHLFGFSRVLKGRARCWSRTAGGRISENPPTPGPLVGTLLGEAVKVCGLWGFCFWLTRSLVDPTMLARQMFKC